MMSEAIDDGGPAFPSSDTVHPNGQVQYGTFGMSLLDYFAGQALCGLIIEDKQSCDPDIIAATAYEMAIAMLNERERINAKRD